MPKLNPEDMITPIQATAIIDRDARHAKDGHPMTTTYHGFPLLQEHSPRVMARKILMHNQFKQFTAVSSVGKSGAGKSTSSLILVHEMHTLAEQEFQVYYTIRWVGKKELIEFDKFIKSLAHVNTILIFEDISYALDMIKKTLKFKIKEAFTEIRHAMGEVNVICIFHYHYTRALDKMMRDSYYTIYTSLGHEEKGNLLHIHGSDRILQEMLFQFQVRSRTQDEKGWFAIPIDRLNENRKYIYWTQNPFQIALTNQHDNWHFLLYPSPKSMKGVHCKHCTPKPEKWIPEETLTAKYMIERMQKHFGKGRANLILRWHCFMIGGASCLNKYDRKVWNWLNAFSKDYQLDYEKIIPLVGGEIVAGKYNNFRGLDKKNADTISKSVLRGSYQPFTSKKIAGAMGDMFD